MKEATQPLASKSISVKPKRKRPIQAGDRFGRLVTVEKIKKGNGGVWFCRCDCGGEKVTRANNLTQGYTLSCGCLFRECVEKQTTHGMEKTPEYAAWANMKHRCTSETHKQYAEYGGRGIKVCERWNSFENFFADMGNRPDGTTLDRRDNNKGYSPENCRWATRRQQQRNRRCNRLLTIRGETRCIMEWAEISGIKRVTIYKRLDWNIDPETAVFSPVDKSKSFPRK